MAKVQIIPRRSFFLGDMLLNESEVVVVEEADVGHLIKSGWVDLVEDGGGSESKPTAGKKSGGKKAPSKVSETDGQREGEGETDGQREGEGGTDGQREGEGETDGQREGEGGTDGQREGEGGNV